MQSNQETVVVDYIITSDLVFIRFSSCATPHQYWCLSMWPGVIFVPCDNKQLIRYLLTLNRRDTVKQLRAQLLVFLDEDESWDLIIAEVFDNHIARVLVSLTLCLLMPFISFTDQS